MKITMIASIVLFLSFWGCKDDLPKKPNPDASVITNDSALNIVWKIPKSNGIGPLSSYTCIYSNLAIFAVDESNVSFNDIIIGLDKNSGKEVWRTDKSFYLPSDFYQIENSLFFQAGREAYAVDLRNGKIIWVAKCPYASVRSCMNLNFEAGKLWIGWQCGDPYKGDSSIIFSVDPLNGDLIRIHGWNSIKNGLHQYFFSPVKIWIHPNGDSILVLNSISKNWNTNKDKADFIAWNMKTDTAYIDIRGYSGWDGLANPLVIGNDIILTDQWQFVHSMNLITLKMNWKITLPEISLGSSFKFHNGLIMTTPSRNNAIAFIDPSTGVIRNTVTDIGAQWDRYHYKYNFMYFAGSNKIYKVDYTIPKLYWSCESPDNANKGNSFNKHMALDAVNDLIYITDYGNFYCLKINK